ncbi:hypothetical protein YTPLAS73_07500 [Nitrosarchaeum sp.]|nr:hypothetical protein YTPLAS73_07500 [Nitrosarchaeum sp.]
MTIDENVTVQIALVAATIAAVVISSILTRRSNQLLKKELEIKIRPIMNRTVIGKHANLNNEGDKINESVYSIQHEKVLFHFINSGTVPAINITCSSYVALKDNNELKNLKKFEDKPLPSMAPNEKYSIDIFYDRVHLTQAQTSNNCYFGLLINYESPETKKYFYRMEGHFDKGFLMLDKVDID